MYGRSAVVVLSSRLVMNTRFSLSAAESAVCVFGLLPPFVPLFGSFRIRSWTSLSSTRLDRCFSCWPHGYSSPSFVFPDWVAWTFTTCLPTCATELCVSVRPFASVL